MTASINFNDLFDAAALWRGGECPWTIFAYPTSIADSRGLPPDDDVQVFLGELQKRGIPVAIWVHGITEGTTYFACRFQDRARVESVISELESQGVLEREFLSRRSDLLFSQGTDGA